MRKLLLILLLLATVPAFAQESRDAGLIRVMLQAQAEQWNRGNIEGYLVGYWQNDSLVFLGKSGQTYGYQATLDRYRKAYPDTAAMGKLITTVLKIRLLSADYAYVTGRWDLARSMGNLSGYYTLLLRRINGEWLIVEDHSS